MALSRAIKQISVPASTQSVAYTWDSPQPGNFQPKGLIFWGNDLTADGNGAHARGFFGAADGTNQRAVAFGYQDNNGATVAHRRQADAVCITILEEGTPTVAATASLTSMDSNGFTLSWTVTVATARVVNVLGLGGDDIDYFTVGSFTNNTTGQDRTVTGLASQPSLVLLFSVDHNTQNSNVTDSVFMLGAASGADNEACMVHYAPTGQGAGDTQSTQRSDRILRVIIGDLSIHREGHLTAFTSDGFTVNFDVGSSYQGIFNFVAIGGGRHHVGVADQPASSQTQSITAPGWKPVGALLGSFNKVANTAGTAGARGSVGAAVSTTQRAATWFGMQDAADPTVADQSLDSDEVIVMKTEGTPTLDAEADLGGFTASGADLAWNVVDGTARQFFYWMFSGDADEGGGGGGGGILRQMMNYHGG